MVDLNLLRVLAAVIEQGTITAAAEQLHVSQPAISQSLNRLRKEIKDELFIREGRATTPTRVAMQLYHDTADLMHRVDAGVNRATKFEPATTTATFWIALTDIGQQAFLPTLIQTLRKEAPHACLEVTSPDSGRVVKQLETGELDATILSTVLTGRIEYKVLHHGSYLCLTRKGLFSPPGPSLNDLKKHPRATVTASTGHTLMEQHLMPGPPGSIVVSTFSTIPEIVATTDLIAFVPEVLSSSGKTWENLDIWQIDEVDTSNEVRAYFSATPKSRASAWFAILVVESYEYLSLPTT